MTTPLDIFTNYTYYYPRTVPACSEGDEISVPLGNILTTPGLKAEGFCRDDLKDLRAGYEHPVNGWTQIGTYVTGNTVIFPAQANHAAPTQAYAIYLGYGPESSSPTSYTAKNFDDRFSGTDVDGLLTKVTGGSGTVTVSGGYCSLYRSGVNDSSAIYKTSAVSRSESWTMEARAKLDAAADNGGILLGCYHSNAAPTPAAWASEYLRLRNLCVQDHAVFDGEADSWHTLYIQYRDSGGTLQYWTGSGWSTTAAPLDPATLYDSHIRATIESNGTQWRITVYKNDDTQYTQTDWRSWLNTYNGGAGYSDYMFAGDTANDYWSGTMFLDYFKYTGPGSVTSTAYIDRGIRNRIISESRTLRLSQLTNDAVEYGYGADQATGRQFAILFTPDETGDYQFFEVLLRQRDSVDIVTHDIKYEIWSTSSGLPNEYIARGVMPGIGIEKSSGAYQWWPAFFPSKLPLTASTVYALVVYINGSGSNAQAINIGGKSVASGGTICYRTRSGSAWGSWSADGTKEGCIKVYKGWPAFPGRRGNVPSRPGTTIMAANNIPSWEASKPEDAGDPPDSEAVYVTDLYYDGANWRALYCSYTNSVDVDSTIFAGLGAASGAALTSLTKYNQDPLIAVPGSGETMLWTPVVYDWTPNNCKGYYRTYDYASAGPEYRKLHHMTNTHANWYQPGSGGGWADDGKVTYPWPTVANIFAPKSWTDGGVTYVQIACEWVDGTGKARTIIAEKDGATSLKNARPLWIPLVDFGYSSAVASGLAGGTTRTADGCHHTLMTEQIALGGDSAGTYYFNAWMCSSFGREIYAPPYIILARDSGLASEYLGVDGAASAGVAGNTSIVYAAYKRYGASTVPKVEGLTNIASITISSGEPATNVVAVVNGAQIDITWDDNSTDETGYYVERRVDGGDWEAEATLGANAESRTDSDVLAGHTYQYRVAPYNAVGISSWAESNEVEYGSSGPWHAGVGFPRLLSLVR